MVHTSLRASCALPNNSSRIDVSLQRPNAPSLTSCPLSSPSHSKNQGKYNLIVPAAKKDSAGVDFNIPPTAAETVSFDNVYVTKPSDGAKEINAKLNAGLNVVVTPGIYYLTAPLVLSKPNQVLLGLGLATLVSAAGTPVITVADVDGVRVAGFLMQAGPPGPGGKVAPALLQWGASGSYAGSAANPGVISDVFARVGGPDGDAANPVAVTTMVQIQSGYVVFDNTWLWRADHGVGPIDYTHNAVDHGLVVSGDNVHGYGMAVEHTLKDLTVWSGDAGKGPDPLSLSLCLCVALVLRRFVSPHLCTSVSLCF